MDIGQPKDFLSGTCLYLASLVKRNKELLATQPKDASYKLVGETVIIVSRLHYLVNCFVGSNCKDWQRLCNWTQRCCWRKCRDW